MVQQKEHHYPAPKLPVLFQPLMTLAGKPLGAHPQVWICMEGILATTKENAEWLWTS